jgi:hypothetical protein
MNDLKTTNYAGRPIPKILGFVWVGWAVLMLLLGMWPLAVATSAVFALGLLDDLFGSGESKGFKGHLRSLLKGKPTTGAIKLFGISLVSFLYALYRLAWPYRDGLVAENEGIAGSRWILDASPDALLALIGLALLAGAAIALTSNLLNLFDLKPGRAAKVYLVLILLAAFLMLFMPFGFPSLVTAVVIFALPILTIIIPDLRERAMLGDAGANTAGFVIGALIVSLLPLWALIVYLLVILALNLASEKHSFSAIIDNNPLLRKLDNIGRLNSGE